MALPERIKIRSELVNSIGYQLWRYAYITAENESDVLNLFSRMLEENERDRKQLDIIH